MKFRNLAVTTLLSIVSLNVFATTKIEEQLFVIHGTKAQAMSIQKNTELIVDHLLTDGFEVYGPKGTAEYLKSIGLDAIDTLKLRDEKDFADYPTHDQMTKRLKSIVVKYPKIAKMFSIGKTVKGRDLWFIKISSDVNVDAVKPEFKYISSMHGDEIVGRELMVDLIDDLLKDYGKDTRITNLIDNTEIYIMPSMNPDGSMRRVRYNSNRVDLNRNFPKWTRDEPNNPAGREVETKAIMDFQASRKFALSANFHGGAVVANYPWDSSYERHPFDGLLQDISLEYANLNPEMRNSREFDRGITNGADWYVLHGGMQDWSYVWYGDLQITVELSDAKWPSYSQIPSFYRSNKDSLIKYIELIHQGAGVEFSDKSASGSVNIVDANGRDLGTYGFSNGEFYKVLEPGVYTYNIVSGNSRNSITVEVKKDHISRSGNYIQL